MNHRERTLAILHDQPVDRIPVVSFGFWTQTLRKWQAEGHIPQGLVLDRPMADREYDWINPMLGFDYNWHSMVGLSQSLLEPCFEPEILEIYPDGKQRIRDLEGCHVIIIPGEASIPTEVGHTLNDRDSWNLHYKPRLTYGREIIHASEMTRLAAENDTRETPLGLFCGSMFGRLRNWLGLMNFTYLSFDEPDLFSEMVDHIGQLMYRQVEHFLSFGVRFDYGHFWEDICGNDGPLVQPDLLKELAAPHYKRITDLLKSHGIDLVTVDCDGWIDRLIPTWLESGINTMFPIEIGNWNASIESWRKQFGHSIKGVGGMDKKVFGLDYAAIDREIERLRPLIDLGGYLPCPDHRIPPDAKWENVQYYCDRMHRLTR